MKLDYSETPELRSTHPQGQSRGTSWPPLSRCSASPRQRQRRRTPTGVKPQDTPEGGEPLTLVSRWCYVYMSSICICRGDLGAAAVANTHNCQQGVQVEGDIGTQEGGVPAGDGLRISAHVSVQGKQGLGTSQTLLGKYSPTWGHHTSCRNQGPQAQGNRARRTWPTGR